MRGSTLNFNAIQAYPLYCIEKKLLVLQIKDRLSTCKMTMICFIVTLALLRYPGWSPQFLLGMQAVWNTACVLIANVKEGKANPINRIGSIHIITIFAIKLTLGISTKIYCQILDKQISSCDFERSTLTWS